MMTTGLLNHVLILVNKDSLDWGLSIFRGPADLMQLECWLKTFVVGSVLIAFHSLDFEVGKRE